MAEYLSEEEQLAQLKSWWSRYGWWLVAAVVLGLGGYFLLQYLEDQRASNNAAASEVFERYQEVAADETKAQPLLERLDGEFAGTAYQLMSLMTRAQMAADAEDVDGAIGFYQTAASLPDVEHFTDMASLRLARALQQQGKSDDAIAALGRVAGEGYRSLVAELKGDILRAQGNSDAAREAYAAAVDAQGENPRTLLTMKLADLSAPEGAAAPAETETEAEAEAEAEAVIEAATGVDAVGNDAATSESNSLVETIDGALEGADELAEEGAAVVQDVIDSELQSN